MWNYINKLIKKCLAGFLCIVFMVNVPISILAEETTGVEGNETSSNDTQVAEQNTDTTVNSYFYYKQKYATAKYPTQPISIDLQSYQISSGSEQAAVPYTNQYNSECGLILAQESGVVSWKINVPESGIYYIKANYLAQNSDYAITMSLLLDGAVPYTETRSCTLSRIYVNSDIQQDDNGDDIRPSATQVFEWQTKFLRDQTGSVGEIAIYLNEGEHDLSLGVDENIPFLIQSLTLTQKPYTLSYQDYLSYYKQRGVADTVGTIQTFQGETYQSQSSSSLWPSSDKSSLLTEPFDYSCEKLNYGGGSQWTVPGDWISWGITVPEDGFYQISIKYRQDYLDGLFTSRTVYIDGELPFEELGCVRFNYTNTWDSITLGDGNQAYSIYLTAGTHTITMENTLGDLSDTLNTLEMVSGILNEQYLSVVMITGTDPDIYRDYNLKSVLPNLVPQLLEARDLLQAEVDRLIEAVGKQGAETSYMEDVIYDLTNIANNIESLTYNSRLSDLKNIISGLSEKMIELKKQGLDIDYFVIYSKGEKLPSAKMNFWQQVKFQILLSISAFTSSYQNTEKATDNDSSIDVWMISGGSEQYMLLQRLIQESFETKYDEKINLKLVTGSITQAIVSGIGPEVVIDTSADTVVNLALRGALEDITDYPGLEELKEQYIPGSFIPFTLENKVYGVPLTNDFSVLFVRTDIFDSLGLSVPKTWDEVIDIAQILERHNMSLGCVPAFASLIYQNGGKYFDDGLTKVLFDDETVIDALETVGKYYTEYGFPITFDLVSRFRTGEMPIAIANYSSYVTLKYSAPEIDGLWEMYTTPGTVQEDGSVNYTWADSGGTGISILSASTEEEKRMAWDFVQWFCGYEVQARYGGDLEASLGVSGRYATANMLALDKLNWTTAEKKTLFAEIENLTYIPIVPGNYYITRGLTNATRAVIYDGVSARETLTEWTKKINSEIARKRNEFSLNN